MNTIETKKLQAIAQDQDLDFRVRIKTIYTETWRYLETMAREVREGKSVNEASHFCRWLQFSGILRLLETHPSPEDDFRKLRRRVDDLAFECGLLYKDGKADAKYGASDIAEINSKLDSLLAAIPQAKLPAPAAAETKDGAQ